MQESKKHELAQRVAERFCRIKDTGRIPYAFTYNHYAVVVSYHERYWGLAIYNRDGKFITNIAT